MDSQVPPAFQQVTTCFTSDILEDGKTLISLCTTSGQLLELIDQKVVESCDFDDVADDVLIFTSYDPVQKYYLVRCKKLLLVIKRANPMTIFKKYENVVQVKIQDRLQLGRPQVVIWTLTEKEPIVTDFVSQVHSTGPQVLPALTAGLAGKLQEMNCRVDNARRLLQEKRSARMKVLYQLTPHIQPPDSETKSEQLVLAWGPPLPYIPVCPPPLRLSTAWRRVNNNKWVIGVLVYNSTDRAIVEVRLQLRMDNHVELSYQTRVVVLPQRESAGAQWTEPRASGPLFSVQQQIPSQSCAVVIGIMDEPLFSTSSAVTVSGVILYRTKGSTSGPAVQDLLDPIQFKVEDLVQGSLQPFSGDNNYEESDLLSVVVTSDHWRLLVSSRHIMTQPLQLQDYGLVPVSSLGCWVGHRLGSLWGLLSTQTQVSSSQFVLDLYARDMKQAVHLIQMLWGQWKVEEYKEPAASLADCIKTLAAELRLLSSSIKPGCHFSPEQWAEFRSRLDDHELATDLAFSSHSSDQ